MDITSITGVRDPMIRNILYGLVELQESFFKSTKLSKNCLVKCYLVFKIESSKIRTIPLIIITFIKLRYHSFYKSPHFCRFDKF
jgi:hypothetical protein